MEEKQVNMSNTLIKGRVTEIQCLCRLLELGYIVSTPEVPCAYDFLLDTGSEILKLQVKTCRERNKGEYIEFNTSSVTHNSNGYTKRVYTKNLVDYFCTFYKNECYLVPINECGSKVKKLRIAPTRNGQTKNICFLENYLASEVLNNQ